ncbi:hypothetical protein PLICRDRAFT_178422 [Plicaturopsis crispa FD-325 SS-3]|nr:hypothetical protein PLICRDRAFT_178422 [Plicaturopsis crispa FD-325 SS-3]
MTRALRVKQEPGTKTRTPCINALSPAHLAELRQIWSVDKRVPTIDSRKAWAAARAAPIGRVSAWFLRCRQRDKKKTGGGGSDEQYELVFGDAPEYIPVKPVRSTTPIIIKDEPVDALDVPSSDSSASGSMRLHLPSSDTAFSSPPPSSPRVPLDTLRSPLSLHPNKISASCAPSSSATLDENLSASVLPIPKPLTPKNLSDQASASPLSNLDTTRPEERAQDYPFVSDPLHKLCNQGLAITSTSSNFTCGICHESAAAPGPNVAFSTTLSKTNTIALCYPSKSTQMDNGNAYNIYPYIPTSFNTSSPGEIMMLELSALPYISRSPDLFVYPTPTAKDRYEIDHRRRTEDEDDLAALPIAWAETTFKHSTEDLWKDDP